MTYAQTIDFLFSSLPQFEKTGAEAYKPGLGNITAFDALLGHPHRQFLTVHVAGTNGKGSVSHILASVLHSAGYRVGLFTSPHLVDFRERIRVDGEMIPESGVVEFVAEYRDEMVRLGLSFFEMSTGLAFAHFAVSGVEVAVVETGLGGRLDSTNIVTPAVSVVTNIGLDHMQLLGDTIPAIAAEKAGIIKRGVPVVVGESDPASDPVFAARARETGSRIVFADRVWECCGVHALENSQIFSIRRAGDGASFALELDLLGACQCRNIVTALAAVDELNRASQLNISLRALREGCAAAASQTGLRGRWQVLGHDPLVVCDTGHNEHGIRQSMAQLRSLPCARLHVVIGFARDKDLGRILPLLPSEAHYVFTGFEGQRALPPGELQALAAGYGLRGEVAPDPASALAAALRSAGANDAVFVGGSNFVVAGVL